jgi:hypothetical protein
MSTVCTRGFAAALLIAIGWCSAAQAVPVELEFSGIVSGTNSVLPSSVSLGDSITFDVFADNGGTSLDSQTWSVTNITSATIKAGSYSATTSGSFINPSFGSFSTNASGQLATLDFQGTQNGTDTNGNTILGYRMLNANDIWVAEPGLAESSFGADSPPNINNTTISLATPLPAALPLFATGIGGLGLLGWRRKRKARAVA